jgi:hypothetical protein
MGVRVAALQITNCSAEPYLVKDYPKVGLLDAGRKTLNVTATNGAPGGVSDPGAKPLTLEPGATFEALLTWRTTVLPGKKSMKAAHLAVAPSPGEAPQTVPLAVDVGTPGTVRVTAWYEHTQLK